MSSPNYEYWLSERGHYGFIYRSDESVILPSSAKLEPCDEFVMRIVNYENKFEPLLVDLDTALELGLDYRVVWKEKR